MELADESVEIIARAADFSLRSMELASVIDVFERCSDDFTLCSDAFARCSIVKTHRTAARARSAME
jgi:hypothetical protein